MGKNRVIYQSQAVYAGPDQYNKLWIHETGASADPANGFSPPVQLQRIQNANYNFELTRQDVNQFGNLAAIDRIILDQPTVGFDTSWYVCSLFNENTVGFKVTAAGAALQSCISSMLDRTADQRNYYVRVVAEGQDAADYTDTTSANNEVIGIGNGFLSNYTVEAAVGGFPTASLTVEGLNIAFYNGTTGFCPWVDSENGKKNQSIATNASPQVGGRQFSLPEAEKTSQSSNANSAKVIKPGDIEFTMPSTSIGPDEDDLKVQSFNITLDLGREPLQKLGSRYAYAREIAFPVTVSCSLDALVGDMDTGDLSDTITANSDHELAFKLNAGDGSQHIAYVMKKAKLDSMDFTNTIGDNKSVSLNFSCQIGAATDTTVGLFMSGVST